jgi:hypothetical protein
MIEPEVFEKRQMSSHETIEWNELELRLAAVNRIFTGSSYDTINHLRFFGNKAY